MPVGAQSSLLHRVDSILTLNYRKGDVDTAYIMRPATAWTVTARMNVSGAKIETEGMTQNTLPAGGGTGGSQHFNSEMEANRKATLSLGVSYLGLSLSAALNPAKMMGKYRDFELNFNSYGRRFGFDFMTFGDTRVPLHYHFPEAIITGRGAVVRQWGNKFFGLSMVFNFTNIGYEETLAIHNIKWRVRTFFGLRL